MNHLAKRFSRRCICSTTRKNLRVAILNTCAATYLSDTTHSGMAASASKMPPFHKAAVGRLETFILPDAVEANEENRAIAAAMIAAWRKTSIFQIQMTQSQQESFNQCLSASRDFFKRNFEEKAKYVDDQSFAGYIASGEELTAGVADYSEIFTVTKDLPQYDTRVRARWPCHGPCPWPNKAYKNHMNQFMSLLGESGDKLLQLTALGLDLKNINTFHEMTNDGWHHMRVLRFPQLDNTNGKGKKGRGIGSHTDYGLLVIAAPETIGGDFVRPRIEGESIEDWQSSAAGVSEDDNDDKWLFVPPVENTMTLLTNGFLPATPHKVALNTSERYAFAYFHEPNFNSVIEALPEYREKIHYGTHFTNQFMNNYPQRITTKRIQEEKRLEVLGDMRSRALANHQQYSVEEVS